MLNLTRVFSRGSIKSASLSAASRCERGLGSLLATPGPAPSRALPRAKLRAFTLTELMVVVLIIGILATLGVAGVRRKMRQSRRIEVVSGLQEIAKAQDRFRAEHGMYLNVSPDLNTYYPPLSPGKVQNFWGHTGEANWRELGPELPQLVSFSYSTIAGLPFSTPSAVDPGFTTAPAWPAATSLVEPWYVVEAKGSDEPTGTLGYYLLSSFDQTIHEQDDE